MINHPGIIKQGTFDSNGLPTGWHIDLRDRHKESPPVLEIKTNGDVYLDGGYCDELTLERLAAMK